MKLSCPKDPSHRLTTEAVTKKGSPHTIKVLCDDCGAFVKWGSHQDVLTINTENAQENNEVEAESAALCPLMSGMVIQPAKSEVRPARLRFEGNACLKEGCAWWAEIDNTCAVTSIAFALLESKMGG